METGVSVSPGKSTNEKSAEKKKKKLMKLARSAKYFSASF